MHTVTQQIIVIFVLLHTASSLNNITNTIYKGLILPEEELPVNSNSNEDSSSSSSLPSLCGSCRIREAVRTRSLEVIKQQILLRLGMQTALNTTGRKLPQVPQEVLAQYPNLNAGMGMQSDQPYPSREKYNFMEEEDNMHIKTEKIMLFSKPCPKLRHSQRHGIQYFQFSENITRHRVKLATLYIWIRGSGTARPSTRDIHIRVMRVVRGTSNGADAPTLQQRAVTIARQPEGPGRWLKMDATVMLSEWFKNPKENLGFVVNATMINGEKIVVGDSNTDGGKNVPFVDIEITDTRKRRTKRTVGLNCNEDEQQTLCCRYPLTVDFEEFGWDFIIAPKRYEANYCAGECPFMTFQKYAHTHLVKMTNPDTTGPCCAPRKFSAISMLYFDQEYNIIYGSLPGMVVDRCGCS